MYLRRPCVSSLVSKVKERGRKEEGLRRRKRKDGYEVKGGRGGGEEGEVVRGGEK